MPASFAHQVDGFAVMLAGVFGAPLTVIQRDALVPHVLWEETQICPFVKVPKFTFILLVPLPLLMVAPVGTVQL